MLEVRNLHVGYGRVPVLRDVGLRVGRGEIMLVLGPNGAGKSTLLRAIGGFIRPTQGEVLLDGQPVTARPPEEMTRLGLRLVLDGHRVFPELTVYDNIRLGAAFRGGRLDFEAQAGPALAMFPILREKLRSPARDLSGGQQQMLALTQAFVAQPKVLLCDEPSLGLAQALIPPILEFLRRWAEQGTAVVIVEQQIDIAMGVADRCVILEGGMVRLAGSAEDLRNDPRVRAIYLGVDEA